MLFNEIYSSYYNAVAAIITKAIEGKMEDRDIYAIVRDKAFSESVMTIPDAIKRGNWPFIRTDGASVIKNKPEMPLTALQKRWLKAIMSDKRIRLFAQPAEGLEDVTPLFDPDDFVYFDRYGDGDPYENEDYINNFRTILCAMHEKRSLRIVFRTQHGDRREWVCIPERLEYSRRDDKFRLITSWGELSQTINIARITSVKAGEKYQEHKPPQRAKKELTLLLRDERNALERAMLHFSHLEKETRRLEDGRYRIVIKYMAEDEGELLIRVLSFGPMLTAVEPPDFVQKIKDRLTKQMNFNK